MRQNRLFFVLFEFAKIIIIYRKGRFIINKKRIKITIFMISKRTFSIFVACSVVVILGLTFSYIFTQQEIAELLKDETQPIQWIKEKEISVIPATGNVDETINALLKEVDDENLATKDLEGDASLIDSDSQEVDDFGQSINENDF
jgi:hypothetical protein